MTADDLREQARQVRIFDELAVVISPDHADALADLIDAVAAHKASFDSPNADVVVRARGSAAAPPPPENENPTQKGGGDDDSAGKGSPGTQPAAAGPGESSSEAESEPSPARQGEGGASASPSQPGVTAEQLLELVTGAPATRKGSATFVALDALDQEATA